MRREITAEDLDGLDRGGIRPQWIEVFGDIANALSVVSQDIEEIVGVFVFTAEAKRQRSKFRGSLVRP